VHFVRYRRVICPTVHSHSDRPVRGRLEEPLEIYNSALRDHPERLLHHRPKVIELSNHFLIVSNGSRRPRTGLSEWEWTVGHITRRYLTKCTPHQSSDPYLHKNVTVMYEYGYVAEEGHRYFVEILYTTARDAPSSPL
jgi:hypothetical protein